MADKVVAKPKSGILGTGLSGFKFALLAAGFIIGILLLLFGGKLGGDKSVDDNTTRVNNFEVLAAYTEKTEAKIAALCREVGGVDDVSVAVSLSGGFEYVYAQDISQSGAGGQVVTRWEYLVVGSGSSQTAVYLTEKTPSIAGVGVVCRGGNDPEIQRKLIMLISAAFDVGSNRIFVTGT